MLNLAFVGDLEGDIDRLRQLDDKGYDAIIQTGDLGLFYYRQSLQQNPKYKPGSQEYENILKHLTALSKNNFNRFTTQIYSIYGTNEDFGYRRKNMMNGGTNIRSVYHGYTHNFNIKDFKNLQIAFVGGVFSSRKYPHRHSIGENPRKDRFFRHTHIKELMNEDVDVLVTHQAATGMLPRQEEGSEILRTLFDSLQPSLYIHGNHHKTYSKEIVFSHGNRCLVQGLGNFSKDSDAIYEHKWK